MLELVRTDCLALKLKQKNPKSYCPSIYDAFVLNRRSETIVDTIDISQQVATRTLQGPLLLVGVDRSLDIKVLLLVHTNTTAKSTPRRHTISTRAKERI